MVNFIKKHPIKIFSLLIFGVPLAWLMFLGAQNYAGYCIAEKRFLPDEEKIRLALEQAERFAPVQKFLYNPRTEKREKIKPEYKYAPYKSIDDLLKQNPDCCAVHYESGAKFGEGIPPRHFWDRVFGSKAAYVTIDYAGHYGNIYGDEDVRRIKWMVLIKNCGEIP